MVLHWFAQYAYIACWNQRSQDYHPFLAHAAMEQRLAETLDKEQHNYQVFACAQRQG